MRYLTRIRPFNLVSKPRFELFSFSILSRRKTPPKPHKIEKHLALTKDDANSLFSQITEILGSGNLALDETPSLQSVYNAYILGLESTSYCTPSVCGNAQEKIKESVLRDAQMGNFFWNRNDISGAAHKITKAEIALEFYKEMVRNDMVPNIKVYTLLLNCLADYGDIDGVYLVTDNMIQADKMDDALEIVDIMKKINVVDEVVYGTSISSYLRKNDAPKALDLLHSMKEAGLTPLISTYTELMQHLLNVNEYDEGSTLFDEMLDIGIKMDNVVHMAMIAGHVHHSNISTTWSLFRKMEKEGTRASQKSYSIFIKEFYRALKTDEIINILRKMHDSKRYCQEVKASGKDHPKEEICTGDSNNAKTNVKSNYVDSNANYLLVEPLPRTSDKDLQTICTILSSSKDWSLTQEALEKHQKVEEALKLFKEKMNMGLVPDKELVEGFFDWLCQAGKLAEARKCLEYLCQVGYTTLLSYSSLIRAFCRRGKAEPALALTGDVKEDRSTLNHYVYGSLVYELLKKGQIDEALAKLESMKTAGVHPTVHVYTSLILQFGKEKKMDQALDIFKKMWEESCHPIVVTYTALIDGYMNAGNVTEAQKLFLRTRLTGPFPDFRAYTVLIAGLCKVGKSKEALQVLYEMMDDGVVPSSINFRTIFFRLNREGKRHLAQTVVQQTQVNESFCMVDCLTH
ncbi:hypothetical protein Cgig2_016159 [Carnegiea gigantea]|uniref:Pentatricopeptide repeat-containing protein n=1 Tax=Carnegiea gigantea TaxID=171969 RepID=A0A9Q1QM44_9CARY|nr:hypothetical protein Cgig2_016159 [Carnegiea gigantea]